MENAGRDYYDERRCALIVQALVDVVYRDKQLGAPPLVEATLSRTEGSTQHSITWNVNFKWLSEKLGANLNFHSSTPLTAGAVANRLIWSAAQLDCDLYLPSPMSSLVGDKLYETSLRADKTDTVIQSLQEAVEFPDIRTLVNTGQLSLDEVLEIRTKSKRFRAWLQQESEAHSEDKQHYR